MFTSCRGARRLSSVSLGGGGGGGGLWTGRAGDGDGLSLTSGVFQEELAVDCGQGEARGMLDLFCLPLGSDSAMSSVSFNFFLPRRPDGAMSSVNIGRFHETSSSELLDGLLLDCATDGDAPGGFINAEPVSGGFFHPMSPGMSPSKHGVFQSICHVRKLRRTVDRKSWRRTVDRERQEAYATPRLECTHTATETLLRTTS